MKYLLPIALLTLLPAPVLAQEYSGNWWVNPQTRAVEQLDLEQLPYLQPVSSTASSDWIEIAQLSGGDRLLVKPSSLRQRQAPGRDPEMTFRARYQSTQVIATGQSRRDEGSYAANCLNGGLIRLSDGQIETSFPVPTLPGTAGEALWQWACQ